MSRIDPSGTTKTRRHKVFRAGHSPPPRGGVAAPLRKCREASEAAQTGWSLTPKCFGMRFETRLVSDHPVRSSKEASRYLLDVASTPPLGGGEYLAQRTLSKKQER